MDLIRQGPAMYAPAPSVPWDLGVRRALLRQFPYVVAFLELPEEIRVLAIAHGKKRPGYLSPRGRVILTLTFAIEHMDLGVQDVDL